MNTELEHIAEQMEKGLRPEDVFGTDEPRKVYRQLSRKVHPDRYIEVNDIALATTLQAWINVLWSAANKRIKDGVYGQVCVGVLKTKTGEITLQRQMPNSDLCAMYETPDGILKVSLDPRNNDLVTQEATVLKDLRSHKDDEEYFPFVSELADSFILRQAGVNRAAVLLKRYPGWYSLRDVHQAYPSGVDPRDMAWMFRRLLVALHFAHEHEWVHGAVLPQHVMIHPELHGLTLIDWHYSVRAGTPIKAIVPSHKYYYPEEVLSKQKATPATDIYMAAMTAALLCGSPDNMPKLLRAFFNGCTLKDSVLRPYDAHYVLGAFDKLIDQLWPRKFRPFSMPASAGVAPA